MLSGQWKVPNRPLEVCYYLFYEQSKVLSAIVTYIFSLSGEHENL